MQVGRLRTAASALVVAFLAAAASAQSVEFDPFEHLPGYEKAFYGEYNVLYDFSEFETESGKRIGKARLDELKAKWAALHGAATKRRAEIEKDPRQKMLLELDRTMRRHAYFKQVIYQRIDEHPPFHFIVQRPDGDDAGYYEKVAAKFAPWLAAVKAKFDRDIAKPLNWELAEGHGEYAIAVLSSRGRYDDFGEAEAGSTLDQIRAHYDPTSRLAVTYEDKFGIGGDKEKTALHSIMHELVHALQHAYYRRGEKDSADAMPKPTWFNEGLAEYLATPGGTSPESMSKSAIEENHLVEFTSALHDPLRSRYCLPVGDILACDGPGYLPILRLLARRGLSIRDDNVAGYGMALFYAESALLVHYLFEGDGGKYRDGFLEYADAVMEGKSGVRVFTNAMAPTTVAEIEAGFVDHIRQLYAAKPNRPALGRKAVFVPTPKKTADKQPTAGGPLTPADTPTFDVSGLGIDASNEELALAAALGFASSGDFDHAHDFLRRIEKRSERLERELKRLSELAAFRRQFVADLVGRGSVRVKQGDADVKGRVLRAGNGAIVVTSKGEETTIPLSDLDAENLVREARAKKKLTGPNAWLLPYLKVLAGQRTTTRDFESISDGDLAGDAQLMPQLIERGGPVAALVSLGRMEAPNDAASAAEALKALRSAVLNYGKTKLFTERREAMADLCEYLAFTAIDPSRPGALGLAARVENTADGTVKLTWDFAKEAQRNDFEAIEYQEEMRKEPLSRILRNEPSSFAIVDGRLQGVGAAALALPIEFMAPLKISYRTAAESSGSGGPLRLVVMICDDGFGSAVRVIDSCSLFVFDKSGHNEFDAPKEMQLYTETIYQALIDHDGQVVRVSLDGRIVAAAKAGPRTTGRLVLWVHTEAPIWIDNLVLEGRLAPNALNALRSRRAATVVEELGLR